MQDLLTMLNTLHRPRLMMRAARARCAGIPARHPPAPLLGYGVLPRHGSALIKLIEMEAVFEDQRTRGDAGYSLIRHLDLLIAMVGEARELKAAQVAAQ